MEKEEETTKNQGPEADADEIENKEEKKAEK